MFMGVTWVSSVGSDGRYDFILPTGNYSITVSEEMLGVSETILSANQSIGTTVEALNWSVNAFPDPVSVQIRTFIDGGDKLFENGTPVNVEFRLISAGLDSEIINVTSDMFTEDGILDMDLNFGRYFLEMDAQDVKNGSEFDTIFAVTPDPISIGVSGIEEPVDLVLQSLWKVELEIKDQSFAPADNVTVVFDYTDNENFLLDLRVDADENGTVLHYVPAGNYTVTIGPMDVDGTTQSFRALVNIDENIDNGTVTIDIGAKAISSDPLTENRLHLIDKPNSKLIFQNEEHGIIQLNGDSLTIGDYVLAKPGHACTVTPKYNRALSIDKSGNINGIVTPHARDRVSNESS
mgnify:CR=1 FL=1